MNPKINSFGFLFEAILANMLEPEFGPKLIQSWFRFWAGFRNDFCIFLGTTSLPSPCTLSREVPRASLACAVPNTNLPGGVTDFKRPGRSAGEFLMTWSWGPLWGASWRLRLPEV